MQWRGWTTGWVWAMLAGAALGASVETTTSDWLGFKKHGFEVDGRPAFVVTPAIIAPGRPWIWRTSFPDFHPEVDVELLRRGYHVSFVDVVNQLGSDPSLEVMDRFYEEVRTKWGLAARPALEPVSRGGLHAYRYAARHPDRIACIYADTPVMDFKSWPRKWPEAAAKWTEAMAAYGFADEQAALSFRGNPLDLLPVIAGAKIPLRHVISLNDRVVPPEENTVEARRRLRALGHDMEIVEVAGGTPASHGHHFTVPEVFASARFVMRHTHVLPRETEYFELRDGLANARAVFEAGGEGRIAFLGGSITFNPGWRDEVMRYFRQRFPNTSFDFVAAGIPSLGSVPHAFRFERDVLARGPVDLLFVEAAVNDHNHDGDPAAADLALFGMEGVVRHARRVNPMTDVVLMHFVHDRHLPMWARGETPYTVAAHERVAERYGCPSLNLSREVADRIAAGEFTWEDDFKNLHPSPYGQQVYGNSITRMLDAAFSGTATPAAHALPPPLDERSYANGRYGAPTEARILRGFRLDPQWRPTDGIKTRDGFVNVPMLVAEEPGAEFEFVFEGRGVGLLVAAGPDSGVIEFDVDGGRRRTVDTFTAWSSGLHLPWAVILDSDLDPGRHTVRVRLTDERKPGRSGTALRVVHVLLN